MVKSIAHFLCWLFVRLFSPLFYDSKYLNGYWFEKKSSEGWRWAAVDIIHRTFFRKNVGIPWPVSPYMSCGTNIEFDLDDLDNFQSSGGYYQTFDAKIIIGKGCFIAQNVGIITSNHDLNDLEKHQQGKDVVLGEDCWVGMNSVILPGVILGPHSIVGAGSVVTKSFPHGYAVIAGNPAKIVRSLL